MRSRSHVMIIAAVGCALFFGGAPSTAAAMDLEAGARVGIDRSLLVQPNDPEGSDTLLYGSAFSGAGFTLGPTLLLGLMQFEGAQINLSVDLLYGFHRAHGYAEHSSGWRQDVTLSTHVVRLPVMVQVASSEDRLSPTLSLGLEPIFGLMSGATVEHTNLNIPPESLETRPTSNLATAIAIGAVWKGPEFTVPVDLRFVWNPFVGSSTEERFDDYQDRDNRGAFQVAFNWQFMLTTAIRWGMESE